MKPTVTWGLDLSTSPRRSAAVALTWRPEHATVTRVVQPVDAVGVVDLMVEERRRPWAVDVPFGWPDAFVSLLKEHGRGPVTSAPDGVEERETWRKVTLARRRTDHVLTEREGVWTRPLPASFDRLGATAAMWTLVESDLLARDVRIDRAGLKGKVCETYPRAALAGWGAPGGKVTWDELQDRLPFLRVADDVAGSLDNDDATDAVICALVARARERGLTLVPRKKHRAQARREGWIHVMVGDPVELLGTSGNG